MSESGVRTVSIKNIEEPLIRGTVASRHDVARLEKAARADPANLPEIRAGIVGGKCYPMGGLDVLAACRAAGITEVRADVREYASKLDLMTEQMRGVSVGEYVDPLRIRSVVGEFGRHGIPAGSALERINLAGTPLARVAASGMTDEAMDMLAGFVDTTLSGMLPAGCLVVPPHILLRISRMEPERQADMAKRIIELTVPEPEMNFAWPTPDLLAYEIRNMGKPRRGADAVVAEVVGGGNAGLHIADRQSKAMGDLARTAKDCMIIPDDDGEPDMLVDLKNHTAKKISQTDDGRSFKLHEDRSGPVYALPLGMDRHLGLASRPLRGENFGDADSLARFVGTLEGEGLRMSLLWTAE